MDWRNAVKASPLDMGFRIKADNLAMVVDANDRVFNQVKLNSNELRLTNQMQWARLRTSFEWEPLMEMKLLESLIEVWVEQKRVDKIIGLLKLLMKT